MRKLLLATLTACFILTSCKGDETLYYNNITMGNIDGSYIVSDQGNKFEISESLVNVDFSKMGYGRVILSCDVLKKIENDLYTIRLTNIASVLTKDIIAAESITPEQNVLNIDNPVIIKEVWYGGGYINMLLQIAVKKGSETIHYINLVYDGSETDQDGIVTYSLSLRHNASGDTPTEEDLETYALSHNYVSFPIAKLIEPETAKITLNWTSHKLENGVYLALESEKSKSTFNWKRTGFIHPQKNSISASPAVCIK